MRAVRPKDGSPARLLKRNAWFPSEDVFRVRCGSCVGCLLSRVDDWAVRMVHQSLVSESSCFLTLTYSDSSLPSGYALFPAHFTLFMKRLRKKLGAGVSYFMCGEYGGKTLRPHYHCALFGEDFSADRRYWKTSESGFPLFRSASLDAIWSHGHVDIGEFSFHSGAYVARYVVKSLPSNVSWQLRFAPNPHNMRHRHELWVAKALASRTFHAGRFPEYARMSRRPALGKAFFERYKDSIYPRDSVVVDGRERKPPRFYDSLLESADPEMFAVVKAKRLEEAPEEVPWEVLHRRGYARQKITDGARRGL